MNEKADPRSIVDILANAKEELKNAEAELDYCDRKTQDILHELELVDHTYHEIARLAIELKDIRKRRRIAKNTIDLMTPLVTWEKESQGPLTKLNNVIGSVRKIEERQNNAIYYKRADDPGAIIAMGKAE